MLRRNMLARSRRSLHVVAMARVWRPDMNDIDRLSAGGAAKRRGTGSFHIPHRLNTDERSVYEVAKKKGFLQVRGSGYRKARKGHPLPNIYRQWCDAKAQPCIVIEQDASGGSRDVVVVDLSPLRSASLAWAVHRCCSLAEAAGARRVLPSERPLEAVPFDAIPVSLPHTPEQMLSGDTATRPASASAPQRASLAPPPTPEQIAAAEQAVLQQAAVVRQLKADGRTNSDPAVQKQVQVLMGLKAGLQESLESAAACERTPASSTADADGSSSSIGDSSSSSTADSTHESTAEPGMPPSGRQVLGEDHPFANVAIWQLPVVPLFFEAERTAAKQLAKEFAGALAPVTAGGMPVRA